MKESRIWWAFSCQYVNAHKLGHNLFPVSSVEYVPHCVSEAKIYWLTCLKKYCMFARTNSVNFSLCKIASPISSNTATRLMLGILMYHQPCCFRVAADGSTLTLKSSSFAKRSTLLCRGEQSSAPANLKNHLSMSSIILQIYSSTLRPSKWSCMVHFRRFILLSILPCW